MNHQKTDPWNFLGTDQSLYLDVYYDNDGVWHPHGTARKGLNGKIRRFPGDGLFVWADEMIPLLEEFKNLRMWCHSSWRNMYSFEELRAELPPTLASRTFGVTDKDTDKNDNRYPSIQSHAERHGIKRYVMIDDDPWAFPSKTRGLVVVNSHAGVSMPGAIIRLREEILKLKDLETL